MASDSEWAVSALSYFKRARSEMESRFNDWIEISKGDSARTQDWYHECKNAVLGLRDESEEFAGDGKIPGLVYGSPNRFIDAFEEFRLVLDRIGSRLNKAESLYKDKYKISAFPFILVDSRSLLDHVRDVYDHLSEERSEISANRSVPELDLVSGLAARFHTSVLALRKHPHKGSTYKIEDEWDCQYLFRVILAAYIDDIRVEEWNPSHAGVSTRCEFFIPNSRLMIELKYVRSASDQKKIRGELLQDFAGYGLNPNVDYVLVLVYDPTSSLTNPTGFSADLSVPYANLKEVRVVVAPKG